jgi:nucleoside-diphosphate-sugar epimerase
MKVLVTGANGYIGRFLCPELVRAGYEVTALTRSPSDLLGVAHYVSQTFSAVDFVEAVKGHEVVIHLAARAHQSEKQDAQTYAAYREINVEKTIDLAKAAIAAGVSRFIYLSSVKVNGEATFAEPFTAADQPHPEDFYGQTKWEAEQALVQLCTSSNTRLVIIRPPLVWGGVVKGNLEILVKLINYRIPLPFRNIQNRRDLVSLDNLSSLILRCIDHPSAPGQVFMVSDGMPRSTAGIIELVASQARFRPRLVALPHSVLSLCRHIPVIGTKINKLLSNLEVDITETCRSLQWQPKDRDL